MESGQKYRIFYLKKMEFGKDKKGGKINGGFYKIVKKQ